MSENITEFIANCELDLYAEYHDIVADYKFVVETERRFYLAQKVNMQMQNIGGVPYFEVKIEDGWVWDFYRNGRYIKQAHICTFKDVNIEEIEH